VITNAVGIGVAFLAATTIHRRPPEAAQERKRNGPVRARPAPTELNTFFSFVLFGGNCVVIQ